MNKWLVVQVDEVELQVDVVVLQVDEVTLQVDVVVLQVVQNRLHTNFQPLITD